MLAVLLIIPGSPLEKKTRLGLDLKGGVELIYEGRPTPQVPEVTPQAIDDAIETIRKRTDALGVSEPEIQRAGAEPDLDRPAGRQERRARRGAGRHHRAAPVLRLGAERHRPERRAGLGRPEPSGPHQRPVRRRRSARRRGSRRRRRTTSRRTPPDDLTEGAGRPRERHGGRPLLPLRARQPAKLLAGPGHDLRRAAAGVRGRAAGCSGKPPRASASSRRAPSARAELTKRSAASGRPPGSERDQGPAGHRRPQGRGAARRTWARQSPRFYYVLEDDSELSGSDIKNPEQNFDPNTNEPIVTFEFTDNGRKPVRARHEADRRARLAADHAARAADRQPRSSASRSRSTTRSSRWRRSTPSRTPRASTAAPARRSTASATSRRRRTSPRACASARCRST